MRRVFEKIVYYLFPRKIRRAIVKLLMGAENSAEPREAIRWLLGIYDLVNLEIDSQSKRWGSGVHIKHELMDGIHSFFYDRIEKGSRVLDLGCGYGALAHAIAEHSDAQVLAIDMDAEQINLGKKRFTHPNIRFVIGNVFTDIPEDGSFDVVVLSSVLEHLKNRPEFLKELTARFTPKKFLIRVPTFERHFVAALKRELGLFPYVDHTHELEYSKDIFYDEMKLAGLEVKHFEIRWADIWAECVPAK